MTSNSNHHEHSGGADTVRLLRDGDEHLRLGRGSEADACFQAILAREPDNPQALHRRGVIEFLRGHAGEAVSLLGRAAAIRGDDAALCGHLAGALMACGQLDEAIARWQRAVELAPDFDAAYAKLGDAYLAKGDIEASESAYRKSIELAPDVAKAHAGLGRMLHFSSRNQEAEAALHRALELGNGDPDTCILVATVLLEAGGLDAALELFDAAIGAEPDNAQAHAGRGLALHWLGKSEHAEAAYRRALSIDTRSALALKHLGVLLQERNQLDAAAECFKQLLEAYPDDDVARHMLAATTGKSTTSAPAGYVTRLFDDYADRFDEHLGSIAYRVPMLIRDAVLEVAGLVQHGKRVLDLGCGTGLCGEIIKPLAAHLAGVDLSARMIAKARERNIYDSLMVGSIEDALEGQEQCYDMIIAGDVFTYVGDLASVFSGCARALQSDGLIALSVESAAGDSYHLCPTGRYAHSANYVDAMAKAARLSVVYRQDITLRNDPVPIAGQIVVLLKTA